MEETMPIPAVSTNTPSQGDASGSGSRCNVDLDTLKFDTTMLEELGEGDWKAMFTDEGYIRNEIFNRPALPKTDYEKGFEIQCQKCATYGLEYYNRRNKGDEYELVKSMLSGAADDIVVQDYVLHANFLAKRKGAGSSVAPELFFTSMLPCDGFDEIEETVMECCIINISYAESGLKQTIIYHPEGKNDCDCNEPPPVM